MSKKMMKRSLALGALMAFVITGQAWAADVNQTVTEIPNTTPSGYNVLLQGGKLTEISGSSAGGWTAFCPNNDNITVSDKLVTNGDITYSDGPLGLFAAYLIQNDIYNEYLNGVGVSSKLKAEQHLDNPNNNILEIKHNLTTTEPGEINLFAAFVGYGRDNEVLTAKGNSILVGGDNQITLKASSGIYIGGANGSNEHKGIGGTNNVEGNRAVVSNVIFYNGDKEVGIYGGITQDGNAKNNEVLITNTKITNAEIAGGYAYTGDGDAIGNTLNIEGNNNITGEKIYGGYSAKGAAIGNTVVINGGTINGKIYGGYSVNGTTDDNIVNIKGNADISNAYLCGSNRDDSKGNTLNIASDWTNNKIKSIEYFNEINIEEAQWGTVAVEVESLALTDTKVNIETVRVAGDDDTFAPKGTSTLISADSITGNVSGESSVNVFKGVATIYEATVEKSEEGNSIDIKLGDETTAEYNAAVMNPQVLVIGESRAAATAFTNQGSELIETGLDALARDNATDTKVFAAVYGNTSEFATGSEVKVNGWSGIVGVGKTNDNGLTVGAFFENGEGNYRTYNNVNDEFMRGDGEACYNGGGFIVRKDNANGVYTEASLRAGNLQNELRNAVHGSEGLTGYDIDTFYYGAHVGIGKVIPRGTEGDSIDIYGKFIYTHHDSEDFTIDGDEFHFDSVDSERLRLGFRINEVQTNKLSMYYGAAWEYEFNGDSNNTVVGYDLSTPSLGGSTVIGEVGMHYTASEKWSFDLNGRAYSGQRDGFSGSVQANYSF